MTLTGLTEFLMARIAEDEAAASAVKDIGADVWDIQVVHQSLDLDPMVTHCTDDERTKLAQHFDPARVLAACDAMRLIVAIHSAYEPGGDPDHVPDWLAGDWCVGCCYNRYEERITEHIDDCPILRALALPFAGHPDFRDEWNR
ncbi:MAG TPA: DUF6221 family protein [Dermatophilaceae bacterium]|jgi:hypothetical protein|nr:DUF6221 family protein [Dermatophilaceae bacterium]